MMRTPIAACALLAGALASWGQSADGPSACGPSGLEVSLIPPFRATPSSDRFETVLVFRDCSDRAVTLPGGTEVRFFLSSAGAARPEDSGPAVIESAPEPSAQELVLQPGQRAHVLLAYYDHGADAAGCGAADTLTVFSPPRTRVVRARLRACGGVYVSEYRPGNFVPGERIPEELLGGGPPDAHAPEVAGPLAASAAFEKQTDIGRACEAGDGMSALLVRPGGDRAGRFEQVDTALGEKTALKDKATGLKWLHLNVTAGLSYEQVKAQLAPGGRFEGWRYATPLELCEFFSHFDGAPDGYSTDAALEAQLQKELGGPLDHVSDPPTGFHRTLSMGLLDVPFDLGHAIFGYIAEDGAGAEIIPKLQGSSRDAAGVRSIGSYLVRKD